MPNYQSIKGVWALGMISLLLGACYYGVEVCDWASRSGEYGRPIEFDCVDKGLRTDQRVSYVKIISDEITKDYLIRKYSYKINGRANTRTFATTVYKDGRTIFLHDTNVCQAEITEKERGGINAELADMPTIERHIGEACRIPNLEKIMVTRKP